VNLVLIEPRELAGDTCVLRDRRALHIRSVLGAHVGDDIRAGVIGGGAGSAKIVADDGEALTLALTVGEPMPALPVDLILAVPRPKALLRAIEIAASFAVRRIDLTNAWRVDKSYLRSPKLAAVAAHARLGAEQGATTHVAPVDFHPRLMPLLDRTFPPTRLLFHPGAPAIETAAITGDVVLAIGPDGGWIDREVDTFIARGFAPVSLGAPILRVEAAVACALGQLLLLSRVASRQ